MDGPYAIEVLTTITAVGQESANIRFSARVPNAPNNQRWKGFKFLNTTKASVFDHCVIEYSDDGALTLVNAVGPELRHSLLSNNSRQGNGGAIQAQASTGLMIVDTTFQANIANPAEAFGDFAGGALRLDATEADILRSTFQGILVRSRCTGLFGSCIATARGGAVSIDGDSSIRIGSSAFAMNEVQARSGGNCFDALSRAWGAAIHVASGTVQLTNTTLGCNVSTPLVCIASRAGAGLLVQGGVVTVANSVIAQNADTTGIDQMGGQLTVVNSIIYLNNANGTQISGMPVVTYSDVQGGFAGVGNINAQPAFSGTECNLSDFELVPGSPAIDAGNPDPLFNDECLPPSLGTERNDMGAFGGPGACDSQSGQ
jgi:hypothetical protein